MAQIPSEIPEGLRRLVQKEQAGELGDLPESVQKFGDGDDATGAVEELGGEVLGDDVGKTNRLLARIVDLLEQLPAAIWDDVEGR